ncbi:hypothetical protein HRbin15_02578 [bacterium HR15]|nr:hypothetical protein HRbin15_02578 [bacterium HR15]
MIDTSRMIRIEELRTGVIEDADEIREMAQEAEQFLRSHAWCQSVRQGYLDRGWAGVLAVFYFEIEPAPNSLADQAVWVIVGDLPPAYLDIVHCPSGAAALEGYVGAMWEWVEHVKQGKPVEGLIPVYYRGSLRRVPPTREMAQLLESRLRFIEEHILPQFRPELEEAEKED